MRKSLKTLAIASALVAGLAATPVLYAHDSQGSSNSMMGRRVVGQAGMMGMMGIDRKSTRLNSSHRL